MNLAYSVVIIQVYIWENSDAAPRERIQKSLAAVNVLKTLLENLPAQIRL